MQDAEQQINTSVEFIMPEKGKKHAEKQEENCQIPVRNNSDTQSEVSDEVEECDECHSESITRDNNVINEVDVSDNEN